MFIIFFFVFCSVSYCFASNPTSPPLSSIVFPEGANLFGIRETESQFPHAIENLFPTEFLLPQPLPSVQITEKAAAPNTVLHTIEWDQCEQPQIVQNVLSAGTSSNEPSLTLPPSSVVQVRNPASQNESVQPEQEALSALQRRIQECLEASPHKPTTLFKKLQVHVPDYVKEINQTQFVTLYTFLQQASKPDSAQEVSCSQLWQSFHGKRVAKDWIRQTLEKIQAEVWGEGTTRACKTSQELKAEDKFLHHSLLTTQRGPKSCSHQAMEKLAEDFSLLKEGNYTQPEARWALRLLTFIRFTHIVSHKFSSLAKYLPTKHLKKKDPPVSSQKKSNEPGPPRKLQKYAYKQLSVATPFVFSITSPLVSQGPASANTEPNRHE